MYDDFLLNSKFENEDISKSKNNVKDLDTVFDNLTVDVANFNKFVSDLSKQKKVNTEELKELSEERQTLDRARVEFENYMRVQKEELKLKQNEFEEYSKIQRDNLTKAETEFKTNMNNSLMELEINKNEIENGLEKLAKEKEQFETYKNLEMNRIRHSQEILDSEREQFEKYKEVSTKKIEFKNKSLEQKCDKFKQLIGQFNSNFKPMIEERNEE